MDSVFFNLDNEVWAQEYMLVELDVLVFLPTVLKIFVFQIVYVLVESRTYAGFYFVNVIRKWCIQSMLGLAGLNICIVWWVWFDFDDEFEVEYW